MVELEADQVSQPGVKAALERFIQAISDGDIPGIVAAFVVAPRYQLERMVDMFLSDQDSAAIEAFKKFLGIASVNAHLLAAQKAADRQAEHARNASRVHFLASRHFSRRLIAVMKAVGNVLSATSALCKYSLRALARGSL
jgi:hypothetical protein